MSFPNQCAFYGRSFYEKKFVTPYSLSTSIPQCAPPSCDLCYALNHNSDSNSQYVQLRAKSKSTIETAFSSMEHMMEKHLTSFQNWLIYKMAAILLIGAYVWGYSFKEVM